MESFGGTQYACGGFTVRKKRSTASRQHCSDLWKFSQTYNFLPPSTESSGHKRKEDCYFEVNTVGSYGLGGKNRLKKFKLKLGGVTHTINTQSDTEYAFSGGLSISKSSQCFDSHQHGEQVLLQDATFEKNSSLRGKAFGENVYANETYNYEPVRKSKRVRKRRVMDLGFNEDDDADEELRYLERLNASKDSANYEVAKDERSRKTHIVLKVSGVRQMDDAVYMDNVNYGLSKLDRNYRKKSRTEKVGEDNDYMEEEEEEEEEPSLDEPDYRNKRVGFVERTSESIPTTRKRALQSAKDLGSGASLIEFPNGLPPVPPKKQQSKLSEVEQQLKRAEAAKRRRLQSERAAKEAEAEAIRKILGQSSAKKKEEKTRKQQDDLAQGKASKMDMLGSNTVRWVIGPAGTVVTFSDDIGLPEIFNTMPCRYPPPREKCAGPNCTNAYKYRDSKSKLPLCSLHCYREIHGKIQPSIIY